MKLRNAFLVKICRENDRGPWGLLAAVTDATGSGVTAQPK